MKIGIGLPSALPDAGRDALLTWARRAEELGFATLSVTDRLVGDDAEPLVALAAAAAVTTRIGLSTNVLIAPQRGSSAVLAKQLASLDMISGHRLVVGLGAGDRAADYRLAGADMPGRFERLEEMVGELRAVWAAGGVDGEVIGPRLPAALPLLLGGRTEAALRRVAALDTGWTMALGTPERLRASSERIATFREDLGIHTPVRAIASTYFGLGPAASAQVRSFVVDYFGFLGDYARAVAHRCPVDEVDARRLAAGFAEAGADELIFIPTSPGIEQLELLASAVLA